MKKILILMAVLTALLLFTACGTAEPLATTALTTPYASQSVTTPETAKPDTPNTVVAEHYTALCNEFAWESDEALDLSAYSYIGTGLSVVRQFDAACNGYKKTYARIDAQGNEIKSTKKELQNLGVVGAIVSQDDTARVGKILVKELTIELEAEWKAVSAKGGYYLMFNFTTNLDTAFCVTVTAKAAGDVKTALDQQENITVTGRNGTYQGVAKCNVPRVANQEYYINICLDDHSQYPVLVSIPLTTTELWYEGAYTLLFQGDWQLIKDQTYRDRLAEVFYTVYPRLYARWGSGKEAKRVTLLLDSTYDGVAASGGSQVRLSTDYANKNPEDMGFFSHEITHLVAKYPGKLIVGADGGWWSENFANYGGFRYFHWGTTAQHVQILNLSSQKVQNWGYQPYGENKAFFAYMDDKYPTTDQNGDGKITSDEYGLIDAINFLIKANTGSAYSDNPTNTSIPFNKTVAEVTDGKYACIEDLRKQFESDCENESWTFVGFGNYRDNFLTENIKGLANPDYPMLVPVQVGDKSSPILSKLVLVGENLAKNASVVKCSHQTARQPVTNLVDGKLETYWHASLLDDYSYLLQDIAQGVVLDLGEVKTFDTYTLVLRGYASSNKSFNAKEWEVLISSDGETFTSIDYQNNNKADAVSVTVGSVTARYVEIRFYTTDQGDTDNARIQEFMLFDR